MSKILYNDIILIYIIMMFYSVCCNIAQRIDTSLQQIKSCQFIFDFSKFFNLAIFWRFSNSFCITFDSCTPSRVCAYIEALTSDVAGLNITLFVHDNGGIHLTH